MATAANPQQAGALDIVNYLLARYGLQSLGDWAWQMIQQGASADAVTLQLYDRPEFKARFPAIEQRRLAGLTPISPDEYIAYESQARQVMQAAGFPPGFYDQPSDFTKFIAQDTSVSELQQRAQTYQAAAYSAPQEVRDQLKNLYGVDEGHLAAYFADPNKALPLIQQQFLSTQIAGQAQRQGFGQLNQSEAQRLASLGVTDAQAAQGFATVNQNQQLFQTLPGEAQSSANRNTALGVVGGDAAAQAAMDLEARRRKAQFAGGGGFAQTQTGTTGLGSANT